MASDDSHDPQSPSASEPRSHSSLERRKFLGLLGAAGVYATPTLVGLFGSARSAQAQSLVSLGSGSGSPGSSTGSPGSSTGGGGASAACSVGSPCGSGGGGGGVPSPVTILAEADSFLRRDSRNTNEGGNSLIRVGVGPITRGVVLFDRNAVMSALAPGVSVSLSLTVAYDGNNWGQQDNRTVDVYPLLEGFVEGNGRQSGMPGYLAARGTGAGVTWNSPDDPDVSDNTARGAIGRWRGGNRVGPKTAAGVVHLNQMSGTTLGWDVTQDILANYPVIGWLIKVTDEGDEGDWDAWGDHRDRRGGDRRHHDGEDRRHHDGEDRARVPLGDDPGFGGTVYYYSIQGAGSLASRLAPQLTITYA